MKKEEEEIGRKKEYDRGTIRDRSKAADFEVYCCLKTKKKTIMWQVSFVSQQF